VVSQLHLLLFLDMVSVDHRVGQWLVGEILMVQMLDALGFYKLEVFMG
jgi:hypothetical protein